jgi:hypothetical protein
MQLLERLKEAGEDFEWYPSTDKIIRMVADDIQELRYHKRYDYYDNSSGGLMDVGAGDGRVLVAIRDHLNDKHGHSPISDLFAIEKSTIHQKSMPKDIIIIGTDFTEQTLVDKKMRYIFSNPPYSEYEEWAVKLIREANTMYLYLVIPRRWRDVIEIQHAIDIRNAEVESIGEFDFENADRRARAKVEVIRLRFTSESKDAFDAILEEMLPELDAFDRHEDLPEVPDEVRACEVVKAGDTLIESLVMAYDAEVATLIDTYRDVAKINPRLLLELGVGKCTILAGIRNKITGLKDKYWKALFDEFTPVTKRLATKQRKEFLASLSGKAKIDFTEGNILSMLIWVTKWANDYFDTQLVELFRTLSEDCNVVKYKSNDKTWTKGRWRYNWDETGRSHYKLEYRLVISHGGISTSSWNHRNGLEERAYDFIQDCVTVANNLGFDSEDTPGRYEWTPGGQHRLRLSNGEVLVAVRAYKNGNLHIHFSQKIILAINVEAGRLLGWLRSPQEAVDELQVTGDDAKFVMQKFGTSFRIAPSSTLLLTDARPTVLADEDGPPPLPSIGSIAWGSVS